MRSLKSKIAEIKLLHTVYLRLYGKARRNNDRQKIDSHYARITILTEVLEILKK